MRPKNLRDFRHPSGQAVLDYCAKQPGVIIENGGRHKKVRRAGFPPVPIPVHGGRDLPTGTWHAIMKELLSIGITVLAALVLVKVLL